MHAIKQSAIDATFAATFVLVCASPVIVALILLGFFD